MDARLIYMLIFALLFITAVFLQKRYCILCDVSTAKPKPFSFSRVQLTWWTFIILASIVSIVLATGQIPTLDDSTLGLLGIGAVTHIASTAIDVSNNPSSAYSSSVGQSYNPAPTYVPPAPAYTPTTVTGYVQPQGTLSDTSSQDPTVQDQSNINPQSAQSPYQAPVPQIPVVVQTSNQPSTNQILSADMPSEGFLPDILSDKYGISIHRFQAFIFNLVFGLWFIYKTVVNLKGITTAATDEKINAIIPIFSTNNLILLGLSAGTYAAIKLTENRQ